MTDLRIKFNEEMVGSGHPAKADTLNRLALAEHNNDGTHNKLTQVKDPWVDVRAFGAVGNGTANDTAAFEAAMDALPSTGGIVLCPPGCRYAVNLTINKRGVRLRGSLTLGAGGPTPVAGLVPYSTSSPVVKVGDDSAYLYGTGVEDLYIHSLGPNGHGNIGLELGGGAYEGLYKMLSISGAFSEYNLKLMGGATKAVSYNFFENIFLLTNADVNQTATLGLYYGNTWATANYFNGLRLAGPSGTGTGRAVIVDGVIFYIQNAWMQVFDGKGVLFQGSSNPYMLGNNVAIDSGSSTDVLVETTCPGDTSPAHTPCTRLIGGITVDGVMKLQDTSTVALNGPKHRFSSDARLSFPKAFAPYFVDIAYLSKSSAVADTGIYMQRTEADTFYLYNNTNGNSNYLSKRNTYIGAVDATYGVIFKTQNVNRWGVADGYFYPYADDSYSLGTLALRPSAVYGVNLKPGAGTVTWTSGAGSPEGALTASVGSLYTRTDGAAGTTFYVKESGSGNSGWIPK